jgi:hypothetical protein
VPIQCGALDARIRHLRARLASLQPKSAPVCDDLCVSPPERELPDLSAAAIARLAAICGRNGGWGSDTLDWFSDYEGLAIDGPADVALKMVIAVCDIADDDALCWIGVSIIEPLLDLHWQEIGEAFEQEARRRAPLRRALSCASLDLKGPHHREAEARLMGLIEPDDDIGRTR